MEIKQGGVVSRLLADVPIPRMFRAEQLFPRERIAPADIPAAVAGELSREPFRSKIRPGMSIAITAGSRGIANVDLITRSIVDFVKARGAVPFIVPAMGSHGGATAEGQLEVLASYGITDEQMNNVRQSAFARAYTSNILSIAYGKDILDILVAVLPCAWVYADYGYRLAHEFADTLDVNQYKSWVDMYKTDEFWQGSAWLIEHIEKLAAEVSEERKQELVDIFVTGVENEYMFWSSAYDMQYTWKPEWDQES